MVIDRNSKMPLYRQVYEYLKMLILSNHYGSSGFLPSERELCSELQVDRATIRRALDLLVEDNLVEKTASVGTRVKMPKTGSLAENNIMFILPREGTKDERITGSFNSNLFYVVERECKKRGCRVIYTTIDADETLEDCLGNDSAAGIMLISKNRDEIYREAQRLGIPTVLVNNYYPGFNSILIDNVDGAYQAAKMLIESGHEKIAVIAGVPEYPASQERITGFNRAMFEAGLDFHRYPVQYGYWTYEGGYNCMAKLLAEYEPEEYPTAVFALNDWSAFGAIRAVEDRGLSVPDDISVVGFNGIELPIASKHELATVKVNIDLMGRLGVEYLLMGIDSASAGTGLDYSVKILVPTTLIKGRSVKERTHQKSTAGGR